MRHCQTCGHITAHNKFRYALLPVWWPWPSCTVCLLVIEGIVIDFADHEHIEREQRR